LTLASAAVGADGVMIEVHPNPEQALSDGPQSLHTERFSLLMDQLKIILPIMGRNLS
jgi:3-deoxy-7-phosphoheptulonate synthase